MTTPRRPPGRYDAPRAPLPAPVRIAGFAVLGLLLLVLTYVGFDRFSGSRPSVGVLGYTVVDDSAVEVRFEVRMDPGTTVACRVRARGRDGAEVGSEEVTVGPSDLRRVKVEHRLSTTARPATGEVSGCRVTGSPTP